ncbi:MAG: SCO family protein [Gammaproteobacteria bacterium]|nr:SCO family protein [Gammaproteobacteria bacterium]
MAGKSFAIFAVVALSLLVGMAVGSLSRTPPPSINESMVAGTVLEGITRPVPEFSLRDHNGQTFNRAILRGKWSFIFFGYTHCPDICPLTMSVMNGVIGSLDTNVDPSDVRVYFVSVDPGRDTLARLAEYVPYFNADFVGVTGEDAELMRLARGLNSIYSIPPKDEQVEGYLVDHSAAILLISPDAELHAVFSAPHAPEKIAADFKTILDRES